MAKGALLLSCKLCKKHFGMVPSLRHRSPMAGAQESGHLRKCQRCGGAASSGIDPRYLGVSRQRVAELCNKGQLEEVNFCGTSFISGRSIEEHLEGEKAKGGRGIKRQTLWQKVVFSYHLGNAIAEIVVPD